jgi:glycosyltransferase involved in cell wall biosynthesis
MRKSYEIVFVDDKSVDSTLERLQEIKEMDDRDVNGWSKVRIIRFSRNFGQTAAMQAGFDHARGEMIVSMDGDLQNDPRDVAKLISKLHEGYDVVCGWRKSRQDKFWNRRLPSLVGNWLIGKMTGVYIHDNGCSLKAYRNAIIKSVDLYSDLHRFIPAMTSLSGARVTEIVVNHRARRYGKTKYGISRIWKVLLDMITVKMLIHFTDRPLLWFSILGVIFFALGLAFGIASILQFFRGTFSIVYPTASFLFLSIFGNLLSLGLLAEFLIKVELRKGSPQCIEA